MNKKNFSNQENDEKISDVTEVFDDKTLEIWNKIDSYLTINESGLKKFDEKEALENEENEQLIELGNTINELTAGIDKDPDSIQARASWLIYGNYCGPGNTGGTPIDDLDRACQIHDRCYVWFGDNTQCNRLFVNRLLPIIQTAPIGSRKHTVAVAAAKFFG